MPEYERREREMSRGLGSGPGRGFSDRESFCKYLTAAQSRLI